MQQQSWTVDVDGAPREVVAATDPESGRTAIRIDGRMAGRPLTAGEDEREFTVGSARYIVRRQPGGELDLDVVPPDFTDPRRATTRALPPPDAPKRGIRRLLGVLIALVLIFGFRYIREAVMYLRVPWVSFTPPDHTFRASFPGLPEETKETMYDGEIPVPYVQYKGWHGRHFYAVERLTAPRTIPAANIGPMSEEVFGRFVEDNDATVVKKEWVSHGPRGALRFLAEVPENEEWHEGTTHGLVVVDDRQVFIVYAYTPRGHGLSFDVGEFLRSFELP